MGWIWSKSPLDQVRRRLFFLEAMEMAENQLAISVTKMHSVSTAISPVSARCAFSGFHPAVVTVDAIAVVPNIHEIIALVDIALAVIGPYAGAGGNGAVGHHGADCYAGTAKEKPVTDIPFKIAKEAFTAITNLYTAFTASAFYKLHQATELFS